MDGKTRLGEFLRPQDVGVPGYGDRRRVPGSRREELALLAGVSASFYTRLEQGQSPTASPEVLDALAGALQLDESERQHLARRRTRTRRPDPENLSAAMAELLDTLGDVPAMVLGRRADVLGWNRMGNALFGGHLPFRRSGRARPNMARMVFLDEHIRELYGADWSRKARAVVGNVRLAAGRFPDDAAHLS
jgi:transcriptional regulator with XRE-family HTH domain